MNTLARQAVKLYPRTNYTSRTAVNALRRGWMRQVEYLGPKWLLHPSNAVQRKQAGYITADQCVFWVCAVGGIAAMVLL